MDAGELSTADRGTATTGALVSAALVLPALIIGYLRLWAYDTGWSTDVVRFWSLAWTVVLGSYFVAVVAVRARTAARRPPAVTMGVAATVLDVGGSALVSYATYSGPVQWLDRILTVVTLVLFVAAWGVARRRTSKWVIGLVPTVIIAVLVPVLSASDWLYTALGTPWIAYLAVWIGAFLLGCVICWGFDAMGSSGQSTEIPAAIPAPVQNIGSPAHPSDPQTNAMAIAALVSSLVFAPLGIVFGHVALRQIKRSGVEGRGLAKAGLMIGYVLTTLMALFLILVVVYFVVMFSRLDDVSNALGVPG